MGLLGGAIFAFGWWYLFISKTSRRWSIGLPLLIAPGGFFSSMQQVPIGTWSPVTGLVYATLVALMMAFVGGIIDFGLRYRNRSNPTVQPDKRPTPPAAAHPDANHEVLGVSPDAGPEEITAAYQAMMQKHQRQPDPQRPPASILPPHQDQSRSAASGNGKTTLNLALFLVLPIAVLIGIVWMASKSGSVEQSSGVDEQSSSVAMDECLSLFKVRNFGAAVMPCRQAAEQNEASAQGFLGLMYDFGNGVPENDVEAVRWYRLAAEQGNSVAQYNLGLMYDNGTGVPEDDVEAVKWYRLAAEQGDLDAKMRLKDLSVKVTKSPTQLPLVTSFAGKMPWDLVDGFSFATHPKVITAISKAVSDDKVINSLLSENVVANPISAPSGSSGVMVYEACEPQNCADNNWRILYYASSGNAEVCLSNRDDPYSFRGWMPSMEKLPSNEDCFS